MQFSWRKNTKNKKELDRIIKECISLPIFLEMQLYLTRCRQVLKMPIKSGKTHPKFINNDFHFLLYSPNDSNFLVNSPNFLQKPIWDKLSLATFDHRKYARWIWHLMFGIIINKGHIISLNISPKVHLQTWYLSLAALAVLV